ncbi:MAG: ABC transporter substrate-binding protein [Gammaproteobacteria bacterium]|nr:ABC transporter substrate-binding protein [Gammaproteobacteria bacterium]
MKLLLIVARLYVVLSILTFAAVDAQSAQEDSVSTSNEQIRQQFQAKFESIEAFLSKQPQPLKGSKALFEFIETDLMSVWSAELTIKAILGVKRWSSLNDEEKQALIDVYIKTMQRYLFETLQKYTGQTAHAEQVQLNSKNTKGWLTTKLVADNFPDINVDLKLYRKENQWLIYDFRFQGISFIKLKQLEYQTVIDNQGVNRLIDTLKQKNQEFIKALKAS